MRMCDIAEGKLDRSGSTAPCLHPHAGMKGVDFEMNTKCPYVDYMTLHVYPDK